MTRFTRFVTLAAASAVALTAVPAIAQTAQDQARFDGAKSRFDSEYRLFQQEVDRYQNSVRMSSYRPAPPRGGGGYYEDPRWAQDDRYDPNYDPSRYYRTGPQYQERVLSSDERVYRGNNGQYYCKRSDGSTGLIVGGIAGGVLGNFIDGGHNRAAGTILGAIAGGALGSSVDRNQSDIRCR